MNFQEKLKELRMDAHLTQQELADAVFVSRTLVSKWESGDRFPNGESVKLLCRLFAVSEEELLCLQGAQTASLESDGICPESQQMKDDGSVRCAREKKRGMRRSKFYASVCNIFSLSLVALFVATLVEKYRLRSGWTGIGAFMTSSAYAIPVAGLVIGECFQLRRSDGSRLLELYSLFTLLLAWIASMAFYMYLV